MRAGLAAIPSRRLARSSFGIGTHSLRPTGLIMYSAIHAHGVDLGRQWLSQHIGERSILVRLGGFN